MRLIDADKIIFDYSGLGRIPPNDGYAIAKYFADQIKAMPSITPQPNAPLTLDELREMSGEPVWVTYGDGWKICYGLTDYRGYLCMETGGGSCICMDHYGKGWWAYRHKLEEGTS